MTSLRSGDQDRITQLVEELEELRSTLRNLQHRKKYRKTGSVSFRTLMSTLQRFHNKQIAPQKRFTQDSPGHETRVLLADVTARWMKELDVLSQQHGYDWRKVPNHPHTETIVFNVDV